MIYVFKGFIFVVYELVFVYFQVVVIGNVIIGRDVYIGFGVVIWGDWGGIVIEDGCNVQENCIIYMFFGVMVCLEVLVYIGYGVIIYGVYIGCNCMVGMNSVIMDNVVIGVEFIIGAFIFVKVKVVILFCSLVVGNLGKVIKIVSDEMIVWKIKGIQLYQILLGDCYVMLKLVEFFWEILVDCFWQEVLYVIWEVIKWEE